MENIEGILKKALVKFQQEKGTHIKGSCLTDNEMASLLDGKVPAGKRDAVFEHLRSCPRCSNQLKENLEDLADLEENGLIEPPKALIQSAVNLMPRLESKDQPISLEIHDLKVLCYPMARAGRTTRSRPKNIKKISFIPNADGFVYLFQVGRKKINAILQKERIQKGIKTELIGKIEKPLAKKKGLILVFAKVPLKNISAIKNMLLKTVGEDVDEGLELLQQKLAKQNAVVKPL